MTDVYPYVITLKQRLKQLAHITASPSLFQWLQWSERVSRE